LPVIEDAEFCLLLVDIAKFELYVHECLYSA
jgi:hypothetical protein